MAKQYNDITEPRTGEHLRGVQTLGENCADNGGIKVWCQSITANKLKDNIMMDPHAPNKYRVNVVLGNFDQFSKTFNCPSGSKMNP
ncbi:PREDICTED: endothelin-converting enzyme 1-like, partial [Rhagoletis zephyria]|uniref:endothelin-converting enzyme 1-like n=1 Tax=Rhagoletis zephyria TaxID=28612 RepID=UPI0008112A9E